MKKFLTFIVVFTYNLVFISAQTAQQFILKRNEMQVDVVKNDPFNVVKTTQKISLEPNFSAPFIAISFKINDYPKEQVKKIALKFKKKNAAEFETILVKPAHDIEAEENYVSELVFLPIDITEIFLEIENPISNNFEFSTINFRAFYPSNNKIESSDAIKFRGIDDCSLPKAVSRSVWGASYNLYDLIQYKNIPEYTTVTHLIVHHGSSPNVATNWAAVVASYFDYHVNINGWSDIGYNYLVAPDGTLFVGRGGGDNVLGAHYCGKNAHTMGVCMIGTYNDVLPTDTALQTLVKILSWKSKKETINPNGAALLGGSIISNIDGHRSGCATDCPGDMVWSYLPKMRERVVAAVNACITTTPTNEIVASGFKISPNILNDGFLYCQGSFKSDTHWQITDMNGRIYKSGSFLIETENFKTPIENLGAGVYFFSIRNESAVKTDKFLKVE